MLTAFSLGLAVIKASRRRPARARGQRWLAGRAGTLLDQGPARRRPRPPIPALAAVEPPPARTPARRRRPAPYRCPPRPGSPGDRGLGSLTPFGHRGARTMADSGKRWPWHNSW